MSIILGLLRFAPLAVEAGLAIAPLLQQALGKTQAKGAVEDYAAKVLELVPGMLAAGVATAQVVEILTRTNDDVRAMIQEGRGPTPEQWASQAGRIKALEDRLDQAAKR